MYENEAIRHTFIEVPMRVSEIGKFNFALSRWTLVAKLVQHIATIGMVSLFEKDTGSIIVGKHKFFFSRAFI